jgi:hypothetical protein
MNRAVVRWLVLLCIVPVACVASARTYSAYEADAYATASEVLAGVQTALLATEASAKGNVFATSLSVLLKDAEDQAGGAQGRFDSVQPPNEDADRLKAELDELLTEAADVLEELRIHVRRGELERLTDIAEPLEALAKKLDEFVKAHES